MSNNKKRWQIMKVALKTLKTGATRIVACQAAGISHGTLWNWCVADPRFSRMVDKALLARVKHVEDALYKSAVQGSVQAQKYFLNNRARDQWQEAPDIVINTGDDNSKNITQVFQTAPDRILFDDGEGDRAEVVPEDCGLTAPEGTPCQESRLP